MTPIEQAEAAWEANEAAIGRSDELTKQVFIRGFLNGQISVLAPEAERVARVAAWDARFEPEAQQ